MKRNNYNMYFKIGLLAVLIAFADFACVKTDNATNTDFTHLGPTIILPEGGMQNFGTPSENLLFPGTDSVDTATFHINYAAVGTAPSDQAVSFSVDHAALDAYNATVSSPSDSFAIFPDSIYTFTATSATVPKGANYSPAVPLTLYPDKIDPTKNYMLPITITAVPGGTTLSANFRTVYFHLIGNLIAGQYLWDFTRWNNTTGTGANTGTFTDNPAVFSPISSTTIEVPSGYFIQPRYALTFTDSAGIPTDFQLAFDAADLAALKADGVNITNGPNIITADPKTGTYKFQYTTDGPRYVIDTYHH